MKKSTRLLSYAFVALGTAGFMFPILSFMKPNVTAEVNSGQMKALADTTVSIIFEPLGLADPAVGKFEPGAQAEAAIDSFANLWASAPSGNIQINKSKMTKSDLFSISSLDSLLQISEPGRNLAKYLTIIKGIDPVSGELKSYLALVGKDMKIIRVATDRTFIQDAGRCPEHCPE